MASSSFLLSHMLEKEIGSVFDGNLLILGEIKSAYVSIASTVYNLRQLLLHERHYFVQFSAPYNFLYSRGATAVAREDKDIVHAKKKENVFFIPIAIIFPSI